MIAHSCGLVKKTKLLPQILPLFPSKDESKVFVDLFGGSGSVAVNTEQAHVIYNDLFMGSLMETMKQTETEDILNHVDNRIKEFNLTKHNKPEYYKFKDVVILNASKDKTYYLDLFTISLFAFNGMLEFNKQKGLTSSFGKRNRRKVVEDVLIEFKQRMSSINRFDLYEEDYVKFSRDLVEDIKGSKYDYKDIFVYADCPYTITRINGYKSDFKDEDLFDLLDSFSNLGIKWALSNVFEHKGKKNHGLIKFSEKYNVHYLNFDYNNMNNSMIEEKQKAESNKTIEVLITNY